MDFFKGYKTHLAAAAGILTSLASVIGVISPEKGMALSALCISLAQIFQRLALAESQAKIVAQVSKSQ